MVLYYLCYPVIAVAAYFNFSPGYICYLEQNQFILTLRQHPHINVREHWRCDGVKTAY